MMVSAVKVKVGRFRMRDGRIAEVYGRDRDPHPYPWIGVVPDQADDDGWDGAGRNWKSAALDLVALLPPPEGETP